MEVYIERKLREGYKMDWMQTLSIIASLVGVTAWLDYKHSQDMDRMDARWEARHKEDRETWKWLFDWAHNEVNDLKSRHHVHGKQ